MSIELLFQGDYPVRSHHNGKLPPRRERIMDHVVSPRFGSTNDLNLANWVKQAATTAIANYLEELGRRKCHHPPRETPQLAGRFSPLTFPIHITIMTNEKYVCAVSYE
jgi:hypothetical protein